MLQGSRVEEGKHFSNCKDHKEQIVIIIIERSKKISRTILSFKSNSGYF